MRGEKTMTTKKEIYAAHGIEFIKSKNTEKLVSPLGLVNKPLVNGNKKIGRGCYHFSTLPGTQLFDVVVNGMSFTVKGTCCCDCVGCYAKTGNYRYQSVKNALGMRTILARNYLDWLEKAIRAQIVADKIETIRIHAAGDFCSFAYAMMWYRIAKDFPGVKIWTYTKVREFESLFDTLPNSNIVKSVIPGIGFNFGHIDFVQDTYNKLASAGKTVHVCRCGVDKDQHCTNCKGCSENEFVLFVEHSTEYKAEKENDWTAFKAWVDAVSPRKAEKAAC